MWVRSDTSWRAEARVFSCTLEDVEDGSRNAHKALVRSADPYAELACLQYSETAEGGAKCDVTFTGCKVVLSAAPVFAIASQVLNAFTIIAMPPDIVEAPSALEGWSEQHAVFWSGRGAACGRFEGNVVLGGCEVVFLQECSMADSPRVTLGFTAQGHYASQPGEGGSGTVSIDNVELNAQVVMALIVIVTS